MPTSAAHRLRQSIGRTTVRQVAGAGLFGAALLGVSMFAGLLIVFSSDFGSQRPVLLLALPMLLILGFAFVLAPKALIVGILLLRACLDPVFDLGKLPGIGGLGGMVNLTIIALAFALVVREPQRVPREAWWVWLPFMAFQLAGLGYAPDVVPALRLFLGQLATMSVFLIAFHLVHDWFSFDRALKVIVASSVPVAIYTGVNIATGTTAYVEAGIEVNIGRYSGPFPHPNILAFYLVLVMGVLLYQWKSVRSKPSGLMSCAFIGYLIVLLLLLFATKTRSAWLSAALLFFVYGLLVERKFLIYLALVPALAMLVPEVRDRILDLGQGNQVVQNARLNSFAWRKLLWGDALEWMTPSRYVFGYGAGGFVFHSITFFSFAGGRTAGAHSVLVQQFFELGIGGFVTYLWMFWKSASVIARGWARDRVMVTIFGSVVFSYLLISTSDNMLSYLTFNWYFWFLVGAVCSLVMQKAAVEVVDVPIDRPVRKTHRMRPGALR